MQIDWRALLDTLGVEWADRGPNTSRNNINIQCPWCGEEDPSKHMALALHREAYYCWRNDHHKGTNFIRVMVQLGVERREAGRLLYDYNLEGIAQVLPSPVLPLAAHQWVKFSPAAEHPGCLNYLRQRGFDQPELVASRYDLRYAPVGKWAQRLLFPIKQHEQVISWSGRALSPRFSPKYLMYDKDDPGLIYLPRAPRETMVLVEGPIDALKIAAATEGADIGSFALLGKGLSATKQLNIKRVLISTKQLLIALDAEVGISYTGPMKAALAALLRGVYIARLPLPTGIGDPAEIAMGDILPWIRQGARV